MIARRASLLLPFLPAVAAAQPAPADAPRVLLNLGAEAPPRPLELERIIEVVAADPDEARRGRERWRQYKQLGLVVVHMPEPGLGSA